MKFIQVRFLFKIWFRGKEIIPKNNIFAKDLFLLKEFQKYKMFKKTYFSLILLCSTVSFAQIGGNSVYRFLNMTTSPRQAALGGKIITIYDEDVNQALFNPAAISNEMNNRLALNYSNYYGDVTYGTASYAYTFDRHLNTFHVGVNYVNYGNFDGRDENGNVTGDFTGSETALSVGYAYQVPNSKFYLGANAKLISSALETYNSWGGALDLGLIRKDDEKKTIWALVARNIGTQFTTYAGTRENLPFEIMAGFSKRLENVPIRWHLNLENLQKWDVSFSNPVRGTSNFDGTETPENVSFFNNALRHVILGAELFPEKKFNVRLGYNFRKGEELKTVDQRNFSGLSFGFGLRLKKIKFNYSYSKYSLASNTSMFGLVINFQD